MVLNTVEAPYIIADVAFQGPGSGITGFAPGLTTGDTTAVLADLASTAAGQGDALIGVQGPLTGTVARTQHQKNLESVSILDAGGASDGITDCAAPLTIAANWGSGYGVIRFPWIPGTANIYYFSTFVGTNFPGVTFDVDPGVVLSTPIDDIMTPTTEAIQFIRPTTFYYRGLSRYVTVGQTRWTTLTNPRPNKDLWVNQGSIDKSIYSPVLCNTSAITPYKITWPTSDTWQGDSFQSSTAVGWSNTPAVLDNAFHMGMMKVIPGQEIMATVSQNGGSPYLAAIVRHTNGFVGIFCTSDQAGTTINVISKTTGGGNGTSNVTYPLWQGTHQSYSADNAEWSIRIDSWQNCSILFNGYIVATFAVTGAIFQAGFGGFTTTTSDTWIVNNMVSVFGKPPCYGFGLNVAVFGDSRTAPHYDCWPDHLRYALDFSFGIRVTKLDNYAVSGATSANQWTLMQGVNLANYNLIIIDIGTNDVQTNAGSATLASNLSSMLSYCAGHQILIINFDQWYDQAQAGSGGQNSLNYQAGRDYRSTVLRLAAAAGAKVLDSPSVAGPIIANYVNSALTPNLTLQGDPTVADNIHPTPQANRVRALAVANAVAGIYLAPVKDPLYLKATALTGGSNGWVMSTRQPYATIDAAGTVTIDGFLNGGTQTAGTVVMTLPQHLWPARTKIFLSYGNVLTEVVHLSVNANGTITIDNTITSVWFSLDPLTWSLT